MVVRVRRKRRPADHFEEDAPPEVSARVFDDELILKLYETRLRAFNIPFASREQWLKDGRRSIEVGNEFEDISCIRAMVAVLDGFPAGRVRAKFPEGRRRSRRLT